MRSPPRAAPITARSPRTCCSRPARRSPSISGAPASPAWISRAACSRPARPQPARPPAADTRGARFAGMDIKRPLLQTGAGPFAGRLEFAGSGVTGHADLGAAGKYQRADFDARATNAGIPGQAGLTIGRLIATGSAALAQTP